MYSGLIYFTIIPADAGYILIDYNKICVIRKNKLRHIIIKEAVVYDKI